MQTIFVFGHKVPDTDAVCASISLSYLKNKMGMNTEPRVLGTINNETKFVLDYFGFEEPQFLNDVKVQIKNMNYMKDVMIEEHTSIYDAYRYLIDNKFTGFPLVNKSKKLKGYVNIKGISKHLIEGDVNHLSTSYDNILSTLGGTEITRFDEQIQGRILAVAYKSETFISRVKLTKNDILIVSDRHLIQEYACKAGVKMLIVTNGVQVSDDIIELAKEHKVNIISVYYGTYKTSNMIRLCNYVKELNDNPTPVTFNVYDYRDDFLEISNKLGHTNYPIVNKKGTCLGMIRLIDCNNYLKQQVILVDHNQKSQSVDGIDEAEILEVIDHHNLGTIGTTMPINFRSMPVGCTCTIVYKMFQENHVEIPKNIAGIMLSAILSDTLLFKSPTSTPLDVEVGHKLAEIAGLNIDEYGYKMFKAASSVAGLSVEEIIHSDMKTFKYRDSNLAIGQVITMDIDELMSKKDELVEALNNMVSYGNYNIALLFITDIIKNGSYIFYNKGSEETIDEAYSLEEVSEGAYLDGVVSRKKQMLPPLLELEEKN